MDNSRFMSDTARKEQQFVNLVLRNPEMFQVTTHLTLNCLTVYDKQTNEKIFSRSDHSSFREIEFIFNDNYYRKLQQKAWEGEWEKGSTIKNSDDIDSDEFNGDFQEFCFYYNEKAGVKAFNF